MGALRNDGGKGAHAKELKRHSSVIQIDLVTISDFIFDAESLAVLKRFEGLDEVCDAIRRPVPS
jgi:5,10-methenyltetrahydromethanopterin hydrogenase